MEPSPGCIYAKFDQNRCSRLAEHNKKQATNRETHLGNHNFSMEISFSSTLWYQQLTLRSYQQPSQKMMFRVWLV
uniref:Uncharacterized protein n=1 Tax=Pararge aegeria TaxID=116150 RepID=S4PUY4_9NEOP